MSGRGVLITPPDDFGSKCHRSQAHNADQQLSLALIAAPMPTQGRLRAAGEGASDG